MEMYADEDSRGGVLEPEGIVGIKFRKDRQLETMARLDPTYADLKKRSSSTTSTSGSAPTAAEVADIKAQMAKREELLLPVYSQISLQFADLHDRAGRMEAKNTIRRPLQWKDSRRFFYWRLRRRLNEEGILKQMLSASSKNPGMMTRERALATLRAWTGIVEKDFERDDRAVAQWYEGNANEVMNKVNGLVTEGVAIDVASLLLGNKEGGLKGVKQVLEKLPVEEREGVLKFLRSA